MRKFGVGFIASGPVAQSIHIPTVRHYANRLAIAHVMDIDSGLAESLASQHGAKWSVDEDELINDPAVDIVVVGSPNQHHARQVIKACEAGKRLVLAEKPLATSPEELDAIRVAAEKSGTHIVVGAMHAFDTAFLEALDYWKSLNVHVDSIEVSCYIPDNNEFVSLATELIAPTRVSSANQSASKPVTSLSDASQIANGILGLAMHDIPLIREFSTQRPTLDSATFLEPFGYLLHGTVGDATMRITGWLPGAWEPRWTFKAVATEATFAIVFPPSYVLAGSATVSVSTQTETRVFSNNLSAYEAEWEEIISLAAGEGSPRYSLERIAADTEFAMALIAQLEIIGVTK